MRGAGAAEEELPDSAAVFFHHRRVGFAGERFLEFRHIHHEPIDAVLAG